MNDFIVEICLSGYGKGKVKGLDTCYSATYMSQTRNQQRFTISEVAADMAWANGAAAQYVAIRSCPR